MLHFNQADVVRLVCPTCAGEPPAKPATCSRCGGSGVVFAVVLCRAVRPDEPVPQEMTIATRMQQETLARQSGNESVLETRTRP